MRTQISLLTLTLLMIITACEPVGQSSNLAEDTSAPDEPPVLVLASHDSFAASEAVLARFQNEENIELRFLTLGDAGEALNKMILSKDAPLADVFFGVDNTFLSRALNAEIFEPYASPLLSQIPDALKLDPENRLLPVDYGFVNLNADKEWFATRDIDLPTTLDDLIKPAYNDLLVVENPATSSPGLAFLLATIAYFGEDAYLDFWRGLKENGVLITSGWTEAYFEHFTVGSAGSGNRPLAVSYSTSPPADVLYATDERTEPASVNISPPNGTFRQIEFVGIVKGTQQRKLAEALVDFLLSEPFQEDIPLQMFVYPANENADLPDLFVQFAEPASQPAELTPEEIELNRERWIQEWTDLMLR